MCTLSHDLQTQFGRNLGPKIQIPKRNPNLCLLSHVTVIRSSARINVSKPRSQYETLIRTHALFPFSLSLRLRVSCTLSHDHTQFGRNLGPKIQIPKRSPNLCPLSHATFVRSSAGIDVSKPRSQYETLIRTRAPPPLALSPSSRLVLGFCSTILCCLPWGRACLS
jgi:hypothetical protein